MGVCLCGSHFPTQLELLAGTAVLFGMLELEGNLWAQLLDVTYEEVKAHVAN